MANEEHVAILKQGAKMWHRWRKENPDVRPQLSLANLSGASLSGISFHEADLSGANLIGANLTDANLLDADLTLADLADADLTGAVLYQANLFRADLSGANLLHANLYDTVLANVDLSQARNLDDVLHGGPSIIDHRTLQRSGPLPLDFLRGCGLSDWEIEATKLYQRELTNEQINDIAYEIIRIRCAQPIAYYRPFISFTEADDEFAERLYRGLQENGVRCWRWKEDARGGRSLQGQIDKEISVRDRVIVVCSEAALRSGPVLREISRAVRREDQLTAQGEPADVLFPIRLDDAVLHWDHPLQADVLDKPVLDFRNWRDEHGWNAAFERLLTDLRPDPPT